MDPLRWWELVLGGVLGAAYLYGLIFALIVIGLAFE
jgi:hypothetical protein